MTWFNPYGPAGYRCTFCGTWVGLGAYHTCNAATPYYPLVPVPATGHRQGWECPKCGGVYAPSMPMCTRCGPKKTTTATDTAPSSPKEQA